jgi:hypothetical protein
MGPSGSKAAKEHPSRQPSGSDRKERLGAGKGQIARAEAAARPCPTFGWSRSRAFQELPSLFRPRTNRGRTGSRPPVLDREGTRAAEAMLKDTVN